MTKQEVINALERHLSRIVDCQECPYFEFEIDECKKRLFEDVVRLLKEGEQDATDRR